MGQDFSVFDDELESYEEIDEELDETLHILRKMYAAKRKKMESEPIPDINNTRLSELLVARQILEIMFADSGAKIEHDISDYIFNCGTISVLADEIELTCPKRFLALCALADNFDIEARVDDKVQMGFMFYGLFGKEDKKDSPNYKRPLYVAGGRDLYDAVVQHAEITIYEEGWIKDQEKALEFRTVSDSMMNLVDIVDSERVDIFITNNDYQEDYDIKIVLESYQMLADTTPHPLTDVLAKAKSAVFTATQEGKLKTEITFPGIWEDDENYI